MLDNFYKTKKWKRLRRAILARDGYQCQEAMRFGKYKVASVVHHVFPREQYPEYQWEPWNLISLSAEAHNEMHDRNTGSLTDKGQELLKRVARKRNMKL